MKSKSNISSSKSIKNSTQKLIALKCKQDHFSYRTQLPPKKNFSSYDSANQSVEHSQKLENQKIQQMKKIIAPPALDYNQLRRSLHESRHFTNHKSCDLPSLKIGSTYKASFLERMNEPTVKGKEQQGFFIKMPWHESPASNYRVLFSFIKKSYNSVHVQQSVEKAKACEDHLKVFKTTFKGKSIYGQEFTESRIIKAQNDQKDCIKNKDHLAGLQCPLKGESEYKRRYEKENLVSLKSIKQKRQQMTMLPEINRHKRNEVEMTIPKKSAKLKKLQTSPAEMEKYNHAR